jgi:CheY-like chemotaxis protein
LLPQIVVIDTSCEPQNPASLQQLAQSWEMPSVPFIAYPMLGEDLLRQQLAVDGFLMKPISTQNLRSLFYQFGEVQKCILVIDDDHDFVHLLARMLGRPAQHSQVINAYSGSEALELMARYKPSLIFLDLELPDMDCMTLIEKIHAFPSAQHIRIIVVSAQESVSSSDNVQEPILLARANGFMPVDLVRTIQYALDVLTRP